MAELFDTVNAYFENEYALNVFCHLEKPRLLQNRHIYSINDY